MTTRFQRRIEDFTCAHCGLFVQGNGYTNHCPRCLWSRHVDMDPGDRLADCGGQMEPVALEGSPGKYRILHRCQLCFAEKWNEASLEDNFEALVALAEARAKRSLGY